MGDAGLNRVLYIKHLTAKGGLKGGLKFYKAQKDEMSKDQFDWFDRIEDKNTENEDILGLGGIETFDGGALGEEKLELTPRQIKIQEKAKFARIGKEDNLKEILRKTKPPGLPKPGESVHIVANKFNMWTMVPVLLERLKKVDPLYLVTWSIAMAQSRELIDLVNARKIGKVFFVAGIYMKRREPVVYTYLCDNLAKYGGGVKCFETHAKILLAGNPRTGDFFTVEASANLSDNPRLEQFAIINDRALYNMHKDWILEAFNMKSERYIPW